MTMLSCIAIAHAFNLEISTAPDGTAGENLHNCIDHNSWALNCDTGLNCDYYDCDDEDGVYDCPDAYQSNCNVRVGCDDSCDTS